jgi:hypothetical protein
LLYFIVFLCRVGSILVGCIFGGVLINDAGAASLLKVKVPSAE